MAVQNISSHNSQTIGASKAKSSEKTQEALETKKTNTAAAAYGKVAKNAPTLSNAANVQISDKAKEINLAKKVVEETPDIRQDKVDHYKNLIANGQYKVDAEKIAGGIVAEAVKDEMSSKVKTMNDLL